jgi:hypothetical protein
MPIAALVRSQLADSLGNAYPVDDGRPLEAAAGLTPIRL